MLKSLVEGSAVAFYFEDGVLSAGRFATLVFDCGSAAISISIAEDDQGG